MNQIDTKISSEIVNKIFNSIQCQIRDQIDTKTLGEIGDHMLCQICIKINSPM